MDNIRRYGETPEPNVVVLLTCLQPRTCLGSRASIFKRYNGVILMSFRGHFGLYSYCTPSHNTNTTVKLTDDNCGTDIERRLRVVSEPIRTSCCSAVLVSVLLQTQSQDGYHLQLCCIDFNCTKSTTSCSVHGLVRPCDPGPEPP